MATLSKAVKDEFLKLACAMSPENISWDGERPKSEVRKAMAKLKAEWAALEKQVGRPVTESEVWGY